MRSSADVSFGAAPPRVGPDPVTRFGATPAPGPLLRGTVIAAAVATAGVVVSASLGSERGHWGAALVALPLLVAAVVIAKLEYPRLLPAAVAALALMLAAVATGGLVALTDARSTVAVHVAAAAASLAASLLTLVLSFRGEQVPLGPWRDYVTLTKPRIMTLLLLTGAAGMFVGAQGWPELWTFLAAMAGLALACGGASALNHVMDADIDRLMGERTAARPVASGRVAAPRALEFGVVLLAVSFALLATTVNVLTSTLALVGGLFYVVVYTGYLKRSTDQNIVIGGAAGAVPPLVGYAAATGSLALPALWLFLIVFLWTPPHFWALALMIKEHYAAANVPMLPGTRGERETTRQILLYSVVMVAFTVAVGWWLGPVYTLAALALGAYFIVLAVQLRRDASRRRAVLLFHYSLAYLALLFVAAAVDPLLV
jgi:heme o synthase